MTDYPREAWQDPDQPVVGPPPKATRTVGVIHYSGSDNIPDDKPAWLRAMQNDYLDSRGYSLGYGHLVDAAGDSYEIRGDTYNMASNPGDKVQGNANDWTLSILLDVTTTSPATDAQIATCRRLFAAAGIVERPVPHSHYDYTSCCGDTVRAQIDAGMFDPAGGPAPFPPELPEDDDMTPCIIQATGTGQIAVLYGDGKLTGVDDKSIPAWVDRYGDPLPVADAVFNDFAAKGG